ncbi:protein FAM110A [Ixodes scapularis]|nr:protein FAM110A [Ixodes scapularis]XP_029825209.2 protein FAM110A [Ixodes scapularis]
MAAPSVQRHACCPVRRRLDQAAPAQARTKAAQHARDRRSAVERLEASKAQYVKSERLLDCRQGLRGGAEAVPVCRPLDSRSPSAYELVERLRASPPAAALQRAPSLRPPSPPMRARALSETCSAQRRPFRQRSVREDGRLELQLRRLIAAGDCVEAPHKSLPDLSPSTARRASGGDPAGDGGGRPCEPRPRTASDYVGRSCSFRQCPAEPPRDVPSPRRPVLRSKSDVAHRRPPEPTRASRPAAPERFFDSLGLDAGAWRLVLSPSPPSTASRFFDSVSSVDSAAGRCSSLGSGDDDAGSHGPLRNLGDHAETSIVEKNARVIKWLFNCRRAAGTAS